VTGSAWFQKIHFAWVSTSAKINAVRSRPVRVPGRRCQSSTPTVIPMNDAVK
jgi:hypothetical protein